MFQTLTAIRAEERPLAWGAFAVLLLVMCGHALLETARDALFLSSIEASRLPWVYLLVAAASFGVLDIQKRTRARLGSSLSATLVLASALTWGLWAVLPRLGAPGLYTLYVLSSVIVTVVLLRFWLSMGAAFTTRQAKRLFPLIGVGGVGGAVVGFAIATTLARVIAARDLIEVAAVAFLLAAGVARWVSEGDAATDAAESVSLPLDEALRLPYVRLVAALGLTATVALTLADFLFKAAVAQAYAPEELAVTFATVYLTLSVLSLAVQAVAVSGIIQRVGVVTSLAVLPLLLVVGASGVAAGLGVGAAFVLKGADGAMRHTLHRTASELLFVPMPGRVRARVKGLIDVGGQRGGQAVASVLILLALAAGATTPVLGMGLVVLIGAWLALAAAIRRPYVDVFRDTLDEVAFQPDLAFPDLDMASLEAVMEALNSPDDQRVVAALEILERERKVRLVPVLLLYHPSDRVVTRVLDLFARTGRTDFIPVADRIQGRATPSVHAAIVRAKMAVAPDADELEVLRGSHCRATRTTATAYLHALGKLEVEATREALDHLLDHENRRTAELAIARAAPWTSTPLIDSYLRAMLPSADPEVRAAALTAMVVVPRPAHIPALVRQLQDRKLRHLVREAIRTSGSEGLDMLELALVDGSLPDAVRWEVPRAIGAYGGQGALTILLRHLPETSGMLQYRVLRAMERVLAEDPDVVGPAWSQLEPAATAALQGAWRHLDQRLVLQRGAAAAPDVQTPVHGYLVRLLRDKEQHAVERVIRLVGLSNAREDFGTILRGLESADPSVRSSSLELLEISTPLSVRGQLLGLIEGGDDEGRLANAGDGYTRLQAGYDDVLDLLLDDPSEALRVFAVAQVGELGLRKLRPRLGAIVHQPSSMMGDALSRALSLLGGEPALQGG